MDMFRNKRFLRPSFLYTCPISPPLSNINPTPPIPSHSSHLISHHLIYFPHSPNATTSPYFTHICIYLHVTTTPLQPIQTRTHIHTCSLLAINTPASLPQTSPSYDAIHESRAFICLFGDHHHVRFNERFGK